MTETAGELREWSALWVGARTEAEAMSASYSAEEPAGAEPHGGGWFLALITVVLLPFFVAWDVLRATACGVVILVDGVALRARTAARLLVGAANERDRDGDARAPAERPPRRCQASTRAGAVFVLRAPSDCLITASATSSPARATPP